MIAPVIAQLAVGSVPEAFIGNAFSGGVVGVLSGAIALSVWSWRRHRGGQISDTTALLAEAAKLLDRKDEEITALQLAGREERARLEAEIRALRVEVDAERQKARALDDLAEARRRVLVEHGWEGPK